MENQNNDENNDENNFFTNLCFFILMMVLIKSCGDNINIFESFIFHG